MELATIALIVGSCVLVGASWRIFLESFRLYKEMNNLTAKIAKLHLSVDGAEYVIDLGKLDTNSVELERALQAVKEVSHTDAGRKHIVA